MLVMAVLDNCRSDIDRSKEAILSSTVRLDSVHNLRVRIEIPFGIGDKDAAVSFPAPKTCGSADRTERRKIAAASTRK